MIGDYTILIKKRIWNILLCISNVPMLDFLMFPMYRPFSVSASTDTSIFKTFVTGQQKQKKKAVKIRDNSIRYRQVFSRVYW